MEVRVPLSPFAHLEHFWTPSTMDISPYNVTGTMEVWPGGGRCPRHRPWEDGASLNLGSWVIRAPHPKGRASVRLGTGTRKRQAQSQGSGEAWVQVPAQTPRGRVNLQASGPASLGLGFLVSTGREQRCPGRAAVRKRPGYHHCSRASPVAVAGSPGSAGTGQRSGSRQAVELKQRPPSLHWLQHEKPKPKENTAPALTSALVPAGASTHRDICGCHALNRVPGVRLHSAGVPWARGWGEAGPRPPGPCATSSILSLGWSPAPRPHPQRLPSPLRDAQGPVGIVPRPPVLSRAGTGVTTALAHSHGPERRHFQAIALLGFI